MRLPHRSPAMIAAQRVHRLGLGVAAEAGRIGAGGVLGAGGLGGVPHGAGDDRPGGLAGVTRATGPGWCGGRACRCGWRCGRRPCTRCTWGCAGCSRRLRSASTRICRAWGTGDPVSARRAASPPSRGMPTLRFSYPAQQQGGGGHGGGVDRLVGGEERDPGCGELFFELDGVEGVAAGPGDVLAHDGGEPGVPWPRSSRSRPPDSTSQKWAAMYQPACSSRVEVRPRNATGTGTRPGPALLGGGVPAGPGADHQVRLPGPG